MKALAAALDNDPLVLGRVRHVFGDHGEEHHLLVQDFVMDQVVDQGRRGAVGGAVHEHGRSRDADRRLGGEVGEQHLERHRLLEHALGEDLAPALPGGHQQVDADRHRQRHPAAVLDLERVGDQERDVHGEEQPHHQHRARAAPLPDLAAHHVEHERGDRHQRGQRHAVRPGDVARRLEAEHQRARHQHQRPVDGGDVDLADLPRRGVLDLEPRAVAQLDGLPRQGERPRDDRL